ncbi:g1126 [Coccomyxa viridis]|uniref:G1126 protein n=1 Tax=Coccomyxa viridis TaxID=1274662 RepID=A0ABP1FP50_9CHLO
MQSPSSLSIDEALQGSNSPDSQFCTISRNTWEWRYRDHSVASQWDLICSRSWMLQLANSGFFLGSLGGLLLFQQVAEELGRKRTLGVSCAVTALSGMCSAVAPSFWWYFVFRVFTGATVAGIISTSALLAVEPVGPNYRGTAILSTGLGSCFGACLLSLLAWLLHSWRVLTFATSAVVALAACVVVPALPESPRWLLSNGRKGDATAALAAIASRNRGHLPEAPLADASASVAAQRGLADVLSNARLRRRLVLAMAMWCCAFMMYYGVTLEVTSMRGDVYLNHFLGFVVEAPAILGTIFAVSRVGRRSCAAALLLEGGAACIVCGVLWDGFQVAAAVACKAGISAMLALCPLYTEELFPSNVQSAVLQACKLAGALGAVAAPWFVYLGQTIGAAFVPYVVFGSLCIMTGFAMPALPETMGIPAAANVQELSSPVRQYKMLSLRQMFRSRGSTPGNLQKAFFRTSDADADLA